MVAGRLLADLQRSDSGKPRINSSVLVIVIILSVVFLCSGILHVLARCLGRRRRRGASGGASRSPNLSVRLQHLFSLHDSGVEQAFIDALPMFLYGSIRGLKDSADCAVCLTEFANEDKLRLLPKCKHAFHTNCIDTWLLSNSTCPLCRCSLLPDPDQPAPPLSNPTTTCTATATAPLAPNEDDASQPTLRGSFRASLRGSFRFLADHVVAHPPPPVSEPVPVPDATPTPPMTPGPTVRVTQPDGSEKTLRVELGKVSSFRRPRLPDAATSRMMTRSYSVGSHQYVVGFATQHSPLNDIPPSKPTHRASLSDGIPELASASHTPWREDSSFWASRGLETPRNLSGVKEIMTPSPGWLSSPSLHCSRIPHEEPSLPNPQLTPFPNHHTVHVPAHIEPVDGEVDNASESSFSVTVMDAEIVPGDDVAVENSIVERRWEMAVDVPDHGGGDSSSPAEELQWLSGRSKRILVYGCDDGTAPTAVEAKE